VVIGRFRVVLCWVGTNRRISSYIVAKNLAHNAVKLIRIKESQVYVD